MNSSAHAPVGIFDSGIGGLTVAHAIRELLPHEDLIYFGDTAHLPYGDKSPASIRQYSLKIAQLLLEAGCKAIVIACNTASSIAYKEVSRLAGDRALVLGVIEPVAQEVALHYKGKTVGVIGTKGTIRSRVYVNHIRKAGAGVKVASASTPLLAPMIEEGFFNNNISRTIIRSYLSKKAFRDIDALVLGCTHYPLIKQEVEEYYKGKVNVIDPAVTVARALKTSLSEKGLLRRNGKVVHRFYVSDLTHEFEKSTALFFGEHADLTELRIWDLPDHSRNQEA